MQGETEEQKSRCFFRKCIEKYGRTPSFKDVTRFIKLQEKGYDFDYLADYYLEHHKLF